MDPAVYTSMTSEQVRTLTNAAQLFEALEEHRRHDARFKGSMHWKRIGGRSYLYRGFSGGRSQSLGARSAETEELKQRFTQDKAAHGEHGKALVEQVKTHAGYIKVNRLNRFSRAGARIVRALAQRGVPHRVIGTNALYVYEVSAGVLFLPEQLATEDVDLLMDYRQRIKIVTTLKKSSLLALVRATDPSFKRLTSSPFEFAAANDRGYRVEFVTQGNPDPLQPSAFAELLEQDDLQPVGIDSLKWLAGSPHYSGVVFDQQGMPLRVDTVDPRAFVLHKWYASRKADREPAKRRRDEAHARAMAMVLARELRHLRPIRPIARLFPEALVGAALDENDEFAL